MKVHTRDCLQCGQQIEGTRTRSEICRPCTNANKLTAKFAEDRLILESMGYVEVKNPELNKFKQRVWTFTHTECGKEQTWTFGNLQTRVKKNPDVTPCSHCKGRM